MKRNKLYIFIIMIAALALIIPACVGSSGGGGGGGELPDGTFIKIPNLTEDTNDDLPFPSDTTRIQILYPASEISGSGYINELIMFYGCGEATDTTCQNMTVKMGHTSLTTLSTTFSANVEEGHGSFITVIDDANFAIPAGASGDEISIPLETSFYYNGVDNLVVEFTQNTACSQLVFTDAASSLGDTRRVYDWPLDGTPDTASGSQATANLIKFVFEGGDNTLFSNSTLNTSVPFSYSLNGLRQQQLYLASDINGSGPITGLGIQVGNPTSEETYTVSVNLGHATVTTLAPDYAANYSDSPVTVANAVSFTVPAGVPANSYVWIPLPDAVFTYNGIDNLILECDVTATPETGDTSYRYHDHESGDVRFIYGPSDASVINSIDTAINHSKLRFNGGTMDNIVGTVGNDDARWFTTSGAGTTDQYLYRASELGTSGSITKIACRLVLPTTSLAVDYPNFDMVMSHTSATTLGTDVAANVPNPVTVHSGTFSLPAGLIEGDWIEIPLTTTFNYDSTQNLVLQVKSDAGTSATRCSVLSDAARFPDRRLLNADRSSPTGTNYNHLKDLRVWITK